MHCEILAEFLLEVSLIQGLVLEKDMLHILAVSNADLIRVNIGKCHVGRFWSGRSVFYAVVRYLRHNWYDFQCIAFLITFGNINNSSAPWKTHL